MCYARTMKYEANTKGARNELLYEYFLQHPELSLKEIGEIFGISKQRVSKIIKREKANNYVSVVSY